MYCSNTINNSIGCCGENPNNLSHGGAAAKDTTQRKIGAKAYLTAFTDGTIYSSTLTLQLYILSVRVLLSCIWCSIYNCSVKSTTVYGAMHTALVFSSY